MLLTNTRGRGQGYWHQMGRVSENPDETATEAAIAAELNYAYVKRPLRTSNAKGHIIMVPDAFAVMSENPQDNEIIALVGKEFEPIQNMRLAELLDKSGLVGPNGIYSMDVCGKTTDGRTVFWALKARTPFEVNGDEYRDHWLLTDGKDGNRALTLALTPVRHICSNAVAMAIAGASIRVGISHTKAADKEIAWWLSIAAKLDHVSRETKEILKTFGYIKVDSTDVQYLLERTYPAPKPRGRAQLLAALPKLQLDEADIASVERAHEKISADGLRQLVKIQDVTELFTSYADNPEERRIAGTLLGLVNAVTDYENHREATNSREEIGVSNMFGQRYIAQANAVRTAMAMADLQRVAV